VAKMSALLPVQRRLWLPIAGLLALLLLGIALWNGRAATDGTLSTGSGGTGSAPPVAETPEILEQAAWTVRSFPAELAGALTSGEKKAVSAEGKAAGAAVKAAVDAALLDAASLKTLAGKELTQGVANALAGARFGPPKGAKDLQITRRVAHIGIDPMTARRAAAEVAVGYKAVVDGKTRRFAQRSTLWLTKTDGEWQVTAFTGARFDVKPQPDRKEKGSDKPAGKRDDKKGGRG